MLQPLELTALAPSRSGQLSVDFNLSPSGIGVAEQSAHSNGNCWLPSELPKSSQHNHGTAKPAFASGMASNGKSRGKASTTTGKGY